MQTHYNQVMARITERFNAYFAIKVKKEGPPKKRTLKTRVYKLSHSLFRKQSDRHGSQTYLRSRDHLHLCPQR